ncbi:translation initiation factor IF-2 subunit beta [Methanoculleus receptaculi]|uniref:Translation initiation factor 2 subunit beta n=1 Tax=Methanoculleus receptaculi TaxID=394967 RepID=A0AAX4FWG1_9EURY|nr:translation initiation factor IF-2 subunit beta [Methanoculleus receptaculi]WOX58296.1 translation initiation factor IF-2 subunit beta [Methanoculleus receptaculi]
MTQSYEDLLKKAYTNITEPTEFEDRFTVPAARVFIEGKTTVLENFAEIASTLRRDQDHLMKHLLGELGTAGKIDGTRAIFSGKFEQEQINSIIKGYVDDYVICSECGKPDTRLVKTERVLMLQCDACGGHRPVRKRKATVESSEGAKPTEGAIMDVTPQFLSKRGDGVVKLGRYTMYVANAKPGQTVKVKITRIAGTIIFTERLE